MSELLEEMLKYRIPGPPESRLEPLTPHAVVEGMVVLDHDWSDAPLSLIRDSIVELLSLTPEAPVVAVCIKGKERGQTLREFVLEHVDHVKSTTANPPRIVYAKGCLNACGSCMTYNEKLTTPHAKEWGFAQDRVTGKWHLEIFNYRSSGTDRTSYSPNSSS